MIAQPVTLSPSLLGRASSRIAVATMATTMPPADSRLPLRAVAGEFIRIRPMTKHGGPGQPGQADDGSEIVSKSIASALGLLGGGFGATGFFLNIWSIRSVTT